MFSKNELISSAEDAISKINSYQEQIKELSSLCFEERKRLRVLRTFYKMLFPEEYTPKTGARKKNCQFPF